MDPLTNDYPHYTPYQYAGNKPIANVDLDGLEEFQILAPVVVQGISHSAPAASNLALKLTEKIALITAKGVSDALVNANTLGISDGLFGTNRLDSYEYPDEKAAYSRGRIGGDAIAVAQGIDETSVGGGIALTTGGATFGVGAGAVLVVGLHGTGVGATATADAAWALKKLYQLNMASSGASNAGSSAQSKKYEPLANTKAGRAAIEENKLPKGFKKTNEFGKQHGQDIYKKGNKYYSKDIDGHNITGGWKVFRKVGTRLKRIGTADKDLTIFKK